MIVLVDFSQMVIASVAAQARDIRGEDAADFVKHIALNQLLALKKRFTGARLILCCDAKGYWRADEFPAYKGHRALAKKDDSFLDWKLVYSTLNELKDELRKNFPYMVLETEKAEADDIISILVQYFQEHELINSGLIEEPNEIVISSTDEDFQQLQVYRNVKQWNNVKKKFMVCKSPKDFLINHICTGDAGDNIPNICTGDNWSIARSKGESLRATPFMTSRFDDFHSNGIGACKNEEERRNFKRNETLVDLHLIPHNVSVNIMETYLNYEIKGSKAKIFNYLNEHGMKLLLSSYQDF